MNHESARDDGYTQGVSLRNTHDAAGLVPLTGSALLHVARMAYLAVKYTAVYHDALNKLEHPFVEGYVTGYVHTQGNIRYVYRHETFWQWVARVVFGRHPTILKVDDETLPPYTGEYDEEYTEEYRDDYQEGANE